MMFMCSRKGYAQFKDEKVVAYQGAVSYKEGEFEVSRQPTESLVKFSSFEASCGPVHSQGPDD